MAAEQTISSLAARKQKPSGKNYEQLALQPLQDMAVPWVVKSVLGEHDMGMFGRSALLWEQMRRDDRISAVMSVRVNALLGLEHSFQPPLGMEKDALAIANSEKVKPLWQMFATPADRTQAFNWVLGMGFAFGRRTWITTEDSWTPQIEVWHPSFAHWKDEDRAYYVNTRDAGEVKIDEADGWWLWTPFGYRRGWAEGYVHKLAMPWLARQWAYRDWARSNELHGLPMVKVFVPFNAQDDDVDRCLGEIANRSSSPTVMLPLGKDGNKSWDFELVEADADTWEAFQNMKSDANTDIAVSVLGQNLTTEVQGGSFAAAKVQDKVRADILDADARSFEAFFGTSILDPYAKYNLTGPTPALRFQTQETDDLTAVGTGLGLLGDGIVKVKQAGVQLNVDELTKRVDVPTTGPAEEPEPQEDPQAAGGEENGAKSDGNVSSIRRQVVASEAEIRRQDELGQAYADAIVASFTKDGARVMNEDRLRVLSIIMSGSSFEEIKVLLEKAYADMDPSALAELLATAEKLAELNGLDSAAVMPQPNDV